MKFPTNRANLYLVIREFDRWPVAGFSVYEDAEDCVASYEQEWLDKTGETVKFSIILTTYYG